MLRCLESRFAVRSGSNRHRFAAISNRTVRTARPKTVRIAVKVLLILYFKDRFQIARFDPPVIFNLAIQGAQNYLPPPPKSKVELWVPKSTVDT